METFTRKVVISDAGSGWAITTKTAMRCLMENRGISVQGDRLVTYCRICKRERAKARRKAAHG